MPLHCCRGKIQRARSFVNGKAAEKSHLNDAALLPIEPGQFIQRVVQSDHVHSRRLARQSFIEREPVARIPLCGFSAARVFHQNLPHQLRADGDEMLAILERACALFLQPQISLVHQSSALQSVVGPFFSEVSMRHSSQLVVNTREHGAQGLVITSLPIGQ